MFAAGAIAARRRAVAAGSALYIPSRLGPQITLSESDARATKSTTDVGGVYTRAFVDKEIVGDVYVEIECVAASGSNCDFSLCDDDSPLATSDSWRPGDSSHPGFSWRQSGTGFSCTPPGSFTSGDLLRAKLSVSSRTVALALNGGSYSADATWNAPSGSVIWRIMSAWFSADNGSFRLPAAPNYSVPSGYTWFGAL
jgi:hypothetical protein